MDLPLLAPIRQTKPQPVVSDIPGAVRRQWRESSLPRRLKPGARVAVGVGSRGIANFQMIARATIEALKEMGYRPFLVAAMGSHGGATPEGQRELLGEYGITEATMGVELRTDMTTVQLGANSWGEPVFWDKNAFEADGAVTISRVKPHTDFRGKFESGILKMTVIGWGKRDGAAQHHRWGLRGLRDMMPESMKVILDKTHFLGGLALLENGDEKTAKIQFVDRDQLFEVEPKLLDQARELMGRLPFEQLDLLVIGEIGKNYSGAGIDPNVVGRLLVETAPEFESPKITRICALDLSPESHGNGTGCGIADLATERLLKAIDPKPFLMNNLTACFLRRSQLPFTFPTDRECIQKGIETCWQPHTAKLRMAIIPNTLEVSELWVSAPIVQEVKTRQHLQITGELQALPFDAKGNLVQEKLFPHSVRGRRNRH
ncbi:MAG TPA: lactate racemase domain-containing protein [Gemmataceae bacterium]|nr:lactate racemase domain-containing protein [Gemmataceae bacterium]